MLPDNKKVHRDPAEKIRIWVYGQPNIGKTTFANQFPEALMINTDVNIKYVDAPAVDLIGNGKTDPWENFVLYVDEFLKGNHTYKTLVIDLLEDVYQYCRNYYCKKLNIVHESDLGFAKAYDIIRNAFLIVLRQLANSDYNIVLISHEDSNVIKDRIGRETTVYSPALPDKVVKKVMGMLEITGRISIMSTENEDKSITDTRILYLTSTKDQQGGNKIPTLTKEYIELSYNNLINAIKGK